MPKTIDSNGYIPSIIPGHDETQCWLCGANGRGKMDRHEVFRGAYRRKSKQYGLWVNLCHVPCHLGVIHKNGEEDEALRQEAQRCAMEEYNLVVDDFIREFGKNYL